MLKCRQLCKVYRFYSYRFYSIVIFIYLFEVTCFRCNLQTFLNVFSLKIIIFKREYLETEIFSDYTVEEKNALFFLNFSNISFFHMVVNYWAGPLSQQHAILIIKLLLLIVRRCIKTNMRFLTLMFLFMGITCSLKHRNIQ